MTLSMSFLYRIGGYELTLYLNILPGVEPYAATINDFCAKLSPVIKSDKKIT